MKTSKLRAAVVVGAAGVGISLLASGTAFAYPLIVGSYQGYETMDACIHAVQDLPGVPGAQGRECMKGSDPYISAIVPDEFEKNLFVVDEMPNP
ncbi:hypothetical protein [Amycolatopsis sp. CA-230715]|uniref:hypothetical protein n=1 Tax=Amycolatopsis sp. CA-230715 TaxID=2745196 RepID=UPI001C02CF7D|nr:hypothetical protein [Amycolatopsis sp. CA-230715]QWF82730.1 hypothetical protein HUW46_06169 [Amycolatopsis sp. CA-230715]